MLIIDFNLLRVELARKLPKNTLCSCILVGVSRTLQLVSPALRTWGLRLEISGQTEFCPHSRFFQSCEVVFLRPVVCIAAEQQSQWRFLFLRQSHDRLSRLCQITGLLTVVVALKPGGCSNSGVVVGISFAQFGGTPGEVRAEATRLNDGDLDAKRRHFARQHF